MVVGLQSEGHVPRVAVAEGSSRARPRPPDPLVHLHQHQGVDPSRAQCNVFFHLNLNSPLFTPSFYLFFKFKLKEIFRNSKPNPNAMIWWLQEPALLSHIRIHNKSVLEWEISVGLRYKVTLFFCCYFSNYLFIGLLLEIQYLVSYYLLRLLWTINKLIRHSKLFSLLNHNISVFLYNCFFFATSIIVFIYLEPLKGKKKKRKKER